MRSVLQVLMSATVLSATTAGAQLPKVGLVHGINSDGSAWTAMRGDLLATGSFDVPTPINLSWTNPIPQQVTQQLQPWMTQQAFSGTSLLLGHSQGGLVARRATHGFPIKGVVTYGTPNYGAALASLDAALTIQNYWGGIAAWDEEIYFAFADVRNYGNGHYLYPQVHTVDQLVPTYLIAALNYTALAYTVARVLDRPADFADLTPPGWLGTSGFIAGLNGNTGLELAANRGAIRFDLGNEGYFGGPFRLFSSAPTADLVGFALITYGALLQGLGLEILGALDWGDPYYFDHEIGAMAVYALGDDIGYLPYLWHNEMIGGVPNDALIFTGAQGIPGFTDQLNLSGIAHTEETGNQNGRNTARDLLLLTSSR